jgi:hypothetical protein
MKVLIIEDIRYKLEAAVDVLRKHNIYDYVHFTSCHEAIDFAIYGEGRENLDLIILDLNFYMARQLIGGHPEMPTPDAAAKFLWQMLEDELGTPVIVFSSEEDYRNVFKEYPIPSSFSEYAKKFENGPLFMTYHEMKDLYEDEKQHFCEKISDLTFIVGHAHNKIELDIFITQFLDWLNSEDN